MNRKPLLFIFILSVLIFSSCVVSNPGRSKYTNHKGLKVNLIQKEAKQTRTQSDSFLADKVEDIQLNQEVQNKSKIDWVAVLISVVWISVAVGSIALFVTAVEAGWVSWAVISTGIFMGLVWVFTILVLIGILMFMGVGSRTPILLPYDD